MSNKLKVVTISLIFFLSCIPTICAYEGIFWPIGLPEIVADAPWRIEPSVTLIPILVLIHDFDDQDNSYTLNNVYVYDMNNNSQSLNLYNDAGANIGNNIGELPTTINQYYWYRVIYVNKSELIALGNLYKINITLYGSGYYNNDKSLGNVSNAFYITSSGDYLPNFDNSAWFCGDGHYHTIYSDNFVEFGAPVNATKIMGETIGLDWVTLTDHSFDLDSQKGYVDLEDNFNSDTINETAKWANLKSECNAIDSDFKCLVGEEVSVRNSKNKFIHVLAYNISSLNGAIKSEGGGGVWKIDLLVLNPNTFVLGILTDFGEYNLEVEKNDDSDANGVDDQAITFNLSKVINDANTSGGFVYLAHPFHQWVYGNKLIDELIELVGGDPGGIINYGLLNRDYVTDSDLKDNKYVGLEIWNGRSQGAMDNLDTGVVQWKELLVYYLGSERRIFVNAGSDAHGDFNYIRAAKGAVDNTTSVGRPRTCCYMTSFTKANTWDALRSGHCFMTDGPALSFKVNGVKIGSNITVDTGSNVSLFIEWKSTAEFGTLSSIKIYKGSMSSGEELWVDTLYPSNYGSNIIFSDVREDEWLRIDEPSYFRLEGEIPIKKRVYTNLVEY